MIPATHHSGKTIIRGTWPVKCAIAKRGKPIAEEISFDIHQTPQHDDFLIFHSNDRLGVS